MFIGSPHSLNSKIGDKPVFINNDPIPRIGTLTCLGVELDGKLNRVIEISISILFARRSVLKLK